MQFERITEWNDVHWWHGEIGRDYCGKFYYVSYINLQDDDDDDDRKPGVNDNKYTSGDGSTIKYFNNNYKLDD